MSQTPQKRAIGKHACERCRQAKVRCLTDTLATHGKCRKCYDNSLSCEWKEISKTRSHKRTHARVAELERQITSLAATLTGTQAARIQSMSAADEEGHTRAPIEPAEAHRATSLPASPNAGTQAEAIVIQEPSYGNTKSVPNREEFASDRSSSAWSPGHSRLDALSSQRKQQLLEIFVAELLPQYPIISLPRAAPLEQLEHTAPFTVRALIATACSISEPRSFQAMHNDNITILAKAVVIDGMKSLDLLQALIITATWSCPPDDLSTLNIYQWSHMACTMAVELGIGGQTSFQAQAEHVQNFAANPSEALMQKYRTMFGVYLTCSRFVSPVDLDLNLLTRLLG